MVRIGLTRWFIQAQKSALANGEVEYRLGLVPQAARYRTLATEWRGWDFDFVEKEVAVEPLFVRSVELRYDIERTPTREMSMIRQMAAELAVDAVNYCLHLDILDREGLEKAAITFVVQTAVLRQVERGTSETPDVEDFIDLVPDLRTLYVDREWRRRENLRLREERERESAERERLNLQACHAHIAEIERCREEAERRRIMEAERRAQEQAAAEENARAAMNFLYSFLSDAERAEAETKRYVTVRNALGEFRVPLLGHHHVVQYEDDQYVAEYCIIFEDRSIPVGDEVLMKIALLKADPIRFMAAANKFVRKPITNGGA